MCFDLFVDDELLLLRACADMSLPTPKTIDKQSLFQKDMSGRSLLGCLTKTVSLKLNLINSSLRYLSNEVKFVRSVDILEP